MKVLVISLYPPAHIPEADHTYHLCHNLAEAGHDVHVLCQQGAIAGDHPRLQTHPVMQHWSWPETLPLVRTLRRLRPDAVLLNYVGHAYLYRPMLTFAASLTRRLLPDARFVTQISFPMGARFTGGLRERLHRIVLKAHGRQASEEYGTLLRDSAGLIILSDRHLPALERQLPGVGAKATLIPPPLIMPMAPEDALARARTRAALGVDEGTFVFAYFGYLYATKGVETLLRAFHRLRQRRDRVKLILIGGGNESQDTGNEYVAGLRRLVQESDLEADVRFTGGFPWDSDQGSRYLRAADAAVLPFDQGVALNNSSFAAVTAHGLPAVTTRGDVLEEPIAHGCNAFLCRPQDPEALMLAMEAVAGDAQLQARLRAGGMELARRCFSWQTVTERVVSCLSGQRPEAVPV